MNKKRLSVVMAGAMLASAVAPVLAYEDGKTLTGAEGTAAKIEDLEVNNKKATLNDNYYQITTTSEKTYEVNGTNRGILVRDLRNLLTSKTYSDVAENDLKNITLSDTVKGKAHDFRNESVYQINVKNPKESKTYVFYTVDKVKELEDALNKDGVSSVTVINRGFVDFNGKVFKTTQEGSVVTANEKFTEKELKDLAALSEKDLKDNYPAINSFVWNETDKTLTVETRKAGNELECEKTPITVGADKVDFKTPIDEKGNKLTGRTWESDWSDLAGFEKVVDKSASSKKGKIVDAKSLAVVSVTNVNSKTVVKLSDLYDGLLLTEKGQELFDTLKTYNRVSVDNVKNNKNGVFTFDITFTSKTNEVNVLTVSSNDKVQLDIFKKWVDRKEPAVDVLAGDNRYETAVKVAKENAKIEDVAINGNIVLVNGNALVDGLAAAPLAASVWNKKGGQLDSDKTGKVAPILLTGADSLPVETKEYIRELVGKQQIQHVDKITVYLVGGETVLSPSLEKELRDLGLRVVRAGGANREETSLAVADVMRKDTKADLSNAFVVGANGEADAMSIASVAAQKKQPIIVESNNGLSDKAISSLNGWKNDGVNNTPKATIIGGKTVVSEKTEDALKDAKIDVTRIGGSNRKQTNAKVISTYATNNLHRVVVSKDGQNNKSELIDALTATSLAVKDKAPIVLATNNLSEEQINSLERKASREGVYVYQVGYGVSRDVLKTIASRVGLAK